MSRNSFFTTKIMKSSKTSTTLFALISLEICYTSRKQPLWLSKINHPHRLSCRPSTDLLLGNCNRTKVTVLLHGVTKKRSLCKEEGTVKNNKNIPQRFIILFLLSKDSLAFPYYLPSLPSIHKYYDSIFIFKGQ